MKKLLFLLCISFLLLYSAPFTLMAMPPHPDLEKKIKSGEIKPPVAFEQRYELLKEGVDSPTKVKLYGLNTSDSQSDQVPQTAISEFKVVLLMVDFSDQPSQTAATYFDDLMYGSGKGSVNDYYQEVSYGNLSITTTNLPSEVLWLRLPQTYAYYVDGQNGYGTYPQNVKKMVEDAIDAANPLVDFSQYDNDGDGYVDGLMLVHSGPGAEFTGSDDDIWSHKWAISPKLVDGVYASVYSIQPEYWLASGDMTIGVFAHEMGHGIFGLPDLYDRDYSSRGVGRWSLMAGGSWGGNLGDSPSHPDAWSRMEMGFISPTAITTSTDAYSFPSVESNSAVFSIAMNNTSSSEYLLIENRQRTGFDSSLPASGLLIYHIDETSYGTQNDNEWYPGYTYYGNYLVALEQADGDWDLEQDVNSGDTGDPYPGSSANTAYGTITSPASNVYSGSTSGIEISSISNSSSTMTADITIGEGSGTTDLPYNLTGSVDQATGDVSLSWSFDGTVPGSGVEDLVYDHGSYTTAYNWPGATMGVHMTPAAPCQLMSLSYGLHVTASSDTMGIDIWTWDEDLARPSVNTAFYNGTISSSGDGLRTFDLSGQSIFFDGDFYIGFYSFNSTPHLLTDGNYNSGRNGDIDPSGSFASYTETYLIRATVQYPDGTIETITPLAIDKPETPSSNRQREDIDLSKLSTEETGYFFEGAVASGISPSYVNSEGSPVFVAPQTAGLTTFLVYRNGNLSGSSINTSYSETLPSESAYTYEVTAHVDGTESDPSEPFTLRYGGLTAPTNLAAALDTTLGKVTLTWELPGAGANDTLAYDLNQYSGYYYFPGYSMSSRMSPDQPCQLLAVKYYVLIDSSYTEMYADLFHWGDTQPLPELAHSTLYSVTGTAHSSGWVTIDYTGAGINFSNDFLVGFGYADSLIALGYDATYDNGRSWDWKDGNWYPWNEAYLIRAIVRYADGTVATLEGAPSQPERQFLTTDSKISKGGAPESLTASSTSSVYATSVLMGSDSYEATSSTTYKVFRDDVEIGTTTSLGYEDWLTAGGTYDYHVIASYTDGDSDPSNTASVTWSPDVSLSHFDPVPSTGLPYAIAVNGATYGGVSLEAGDEIAVFDGNLCVGAAVVQGRFPVSFAAWEKDESAGLLGFTPGETIVFKVYDSSTDTEKLARASYTIGDGSFGYGYASRVDLTVIDNIVQTEYLATGKYELISFYAIPENGAVGSVFGDIEDLGIVYQDDGKIYWPEASVNTIKEINMTEGYRVYVNTLDTLAVMGLPVEDNLVYNVEGGQWNWLGHPYTTPTNIETAFAGVSDKLVIALNDDGEIYWPSASVNTIGQLQPGVGYQVFFKADTSFSYSTLTESGIASPKPDWITALPVVSTTSITPTGMPYPVMVNLEETLVNQGATEVRLYSNGIEVGAGEVLADRHEALVITWQGDASHGLAGFVSGEVPDAVVFDQTGKTMSTKVEIGGTVLGAGAFGTIRVEALSSLPSSFEVSDVYPNPFNPDITVPFALPEVGEVQIEVYNLLGQRVFRSAGEYNAGYHRFTLRAQNSWTSGVYILTLRYKGHRNVQKILLVK